MFNKKLKPKNLHRFGETISIPYWTARWKPQSFYDKLLENYKRNCHTLCLLDIKVKEVSEENMRRCRFNIFEPPRFMTVGEALEQLLAIAVDPDEVVAGLPRPRGMVGVEAVLPFANMLKRTKSEQAPRSAAGSFRPTGSR